MRRLGGLGNSGGKGRLGGVSQGRVERSLCRLLRARGSGPREAMIRWVVALGMSLDKPRGQPDPHNPAWPLGLWERQCQNSERHCTVRVLRRGLGRSWTPGRAS